MIINTAIRATNQACRQGRFERVRSNFLLAFKILYITYFKLLTIYKWSTSLATNENHRSSNQFGCSYAPCLFMEDQRGECA